MQVSARCCSHKSPPQAHTPQSELILEFCETKLPLFSRAVSFGSWKFVSSVQALTGKRLHLRQFSIEGFWWTDP